MSVLEPSYEGETFKQKRRRLVKYSIDVPLVDPANGILESRDPCPGCGEHRQGNQRIFKTGDDGEPL